MYMFLLILVFFISETESTWIMMTRWEWLAQGDLPLSIQMTFYIPSHLKIIITTHHTNNIADTLENDYLYSPAE